MAARYTNKDQIVTLDGDAITYITAVTVDDGHTPTQFEAGTGKSAQAGQYRFHLSVEYEWDSTASTGNNAILSAAFAAAEATPIELVWQPGGDTAGYPEITAEVCITKYGPQGGLSREGRLLCMAEFYLHEAYTTKPAWTTVGA